MSAKDNFLKVKHLYNRAGFGVSYADLQKLSKKNLDKVVDNLLKDSLKNDPINLVNDYESKRQLLVQAGLYSKKDLTDEEKKMRQQIVREQNEVSRDLNIAFITKMINTDAPLREKMTLFWHGHFACRSNNPFFAQQLNNIQRANALGSFKTLLIEVSKSPAMLQYLNNQQNRKGKPNENFARELMELFTLGRGNYTEQDIKESARSFTGWMYDKDGSFIFRQNLHDPGTKTFFGKIGNFEGENIIDIILEKPETSQFIARKVYKFFVNDNPNEDHIKELATHFYNSKYDIGSMMKKMFTSDWFYSPENVGTKIKSPAEFLVGLSREFYVTYNKPQVLIQLQSSLGQYLFNPPNVAGWPGGQSWIDSSSLMLRMRIPSLVLNDGEIDFSGKADPEDEAVIALSRTATTNANANMKPKSYVNANADWPKFLDTLPKGLTPLELTEFLLQPKLNAKITTMVSDNKGLRSTAVEITSMPEYQLC
ncbi:hypothetical protein SRABI27_01570 [Pedobacter sp. Bi27]|uniref:DUF1800 domain-containing protein n=1 Tax=unclassified Pedobacter TaxID=2628915 RepID=UPI001DB03ACD|nr:MULTISPECIES: DUF1800 domain-containing protein [unclassified Pedobacter]CAH0169810.1 hypothetical protein SRABI36_01231 [Pedobacter sp. Bi36]CAH0193729.1 hypothetical protein SRABI27_01570 [Pedobacter sp. Bi27]CAH0225587.1 hypothetical protein SRABI126_02324 [Pedobacter sp. Bi126]